MRQYLIPEEGRFYKANMHTHTTCSDGQLTPEQIKELYKSYGYSVVAYTDHDIMIDHSDLNDENFLAITSYEVETNRPTDGFDAWDRTPTYHLNFYASRPDETNYPCANPGYTWGNARALVQDYYTGDYQRRYSVEGQNDMIAQATAAGFLVSYNHPDWSLQHYPDYAGLEGLHTIEVYNSGCFLAGYSIDASEHAFQDMLAQGKRVFPTATDDIHTPKDAFGGWIRVKAKALTYDDYMAAYRKGDFYASWGPAIEDLYLEDGVLHVFCSGAREISLHTERRVARRVFATDGALTVAEFDLKQYFDNVHRGGNDERAFIRLVLVDENGNKALTRAYFANELSLAARGLEKA